MFIINWPWKYDAIYDRIRYLIGLKSGTTYVFSYRYAKIKIDSDDYLPQEKTLTLHNVITLIKSVFNKKIKIATNVLYFRKMFQSIS